ncbi:MAG TPA: aminoacyl-tRNA hydrolase [Spirochaetota bacterium]|nr:aminoacyl-tRNA hydrolase [Spirochaetota bacterium]
MIIIACLGNPGTKYRFNRHNCGFLTAYYLAEKNGADISKKQFNALTAKFRIAEKEVMLVLPQTYMNLSGESVSAALKYYDLDHRSLIVIHDELELPFGDIREKKGGGHKGHNGIRSIIASIGSAEFSRVRFGIGRPPSDKIPVASYVLSDFSPEEKAELEDCYKKASSLIEEFCIAN